MSKENVLDWFNELDEELEDEEKEEEEKNIKELSRSFLQCVFAWCNEHYEELERL